jgi:RimJ/RimL family protein N-acetyltransferase
MVQNIQTERLILRQWTRSDLAPYVGLCSNPNVMRWIGNGSVQTRTECEKAIQYFQIGWKDRGFGLFAVELMRDGRFIGFCGLSVPTFLPEILPAVEIGWRLDMAYWGSGYGTEAAEASLSFGLDTLGLDQIVSIHQVGNDASTRIIRKIGMCFDKETIDPSCERLVHIYRKN